jgi:peptide/nickel transport system substrate-binding protein
VAGEASDIIDALQITSEFWLDIGIKMVIKPEDPSDLNQRAFAGQTVMVAAQGLDNAIPTAVMSPTDLAPLRQDVMAWPKWGQYVETAGMTGEKPDMPGAVELLDLYQRWMNAATLNDKTQVWRRMLSLHADQQFIIGTVQGALQPIIASKTLQNIPKKAVFSWEPTANLGVYRVDEFFFEQKVAQAETAQ